MTDTPPQTDRLQRLLNAQEDLQIKAYDGSPAGMLPDDPEAAIEFIKWNVLALTDELHELLGEIGWKPWATSRHVNLTAARGELIDAFHFFMNLALVLNMDASDLFLGYMKKHEKNIERQEEGYDGVSTKCPGCKRALDDDGVDCSFEPAYRLGHEVVAAVVCARFGRAFKIGPAQ